MTLLLISLACIGLLITAAWYDFSSRTIPNKVSLAILFLACLRFLITGNDPLVPLGISLLVLCVGFLLYLGRLLGAGDTKLMAALSLFLEPAAMPGFLVITALSGGLLALFTVLKEVSVKLGLDATSASALKQRADTGRTSGDLPYGVAIAAGGVFAVFSSEPGIYEWFCATFFS
ncbi:A24 family peptidase [Fodinicurvata sediminis]|uniref:A24 family peptidase n=1 Tax=Fodinicurvata sediminis TaxID=1121832 RepID=UPI0003B7532E|nr:prepilin peptidase [Fodinicurvata sediminis]